MKTLPIRSERVVESGGKRARRQVGSVGSAAALQLEADERAARVAEAVHEVAGTKPQAPVAGMVRVGTQVVVYAFDPELAREVASQRQFESVAVEAASEIIDLVLLENRERGASIKPAARVPRAEQGCLVAALRLVERWKVNAIAHLVVGPADREPPPSCEDDRSSERIGP